jgi:hypothetical protein
MGKKIAMMSVAVPVIPDPINAGSHADLAISETPFLLSSTS